MFLRAMLINALHAALEDAVIAFNRVRVDVHAGLSVRIAVFVARMVHSVMLSKLVAKLAITRRFVSHNVAFATQIGANDWQNVFFLDAIDMEGAHRTTALHKRQNNMFVTDALLNDRTFLAADESLVNLDNRTSATHRS